MNHKLHNINLKLSILPFFNKKNIINYTRYLNYKK